MAARNGHLEMCTLLCEAGASLKATNNSGRTALLEACQFHQSHVIPYLREIARRKKAERDAIRLKKQVTIEFIDSVHLPIQVLVDALRDDI